MSQCTDKKKSALCDVKYQTYFNFYSPSLKREVEVRDFFPPTIRVDINVRRSHYPFVTSTKSEVHTSHIGIEKGDKGEQMRRDMEQYFDAKVLPTLKVSKIVGTKVFAEKKSN